MTASPKQRMADLDALLAELGELRAHIKKLPTDDPDRAALEERRDSIHNQARFEADRRRPIEDLRRELASSQQRIAELDRMRIAPSFTERRRERWPVGNPTGYIRKINSTIEENTRNERTLLVERIAELTSFLGER